MTNSGEQGRECGDRVRRSSERGPQKIVNLFLKLGSGYRDVCPLRHYSLRCICTSCKGILKTFKVGSFPQNDWVVIGQ